MEWGGAFAALGDDIYGMHYNPAGLGQLHLPQASGMYLAGISDVTLHFLGFGIPLPISGFSGSGSSVIGASVLLSQSGDFTYNPLNPDGSAGLSQTLKAGSDMVATLGYGERMAANAFSIGEYTGKVDHYFGGSVKYISSKLLETYSASAVAFDAGYLAMEPRLGLSFGASASNIGGKMKFVSESDPLPVVVRAGIAWQKPTIMDQLIVISVQGDRYIQEAVNRLRGGFEYRFERIFTLRLGYQGQQGMDGFTAGIGIHQGNLSLDVGMARCETMGNTHQLALTYSFRPSPKKYSPKRGGSGYKEKENKKTLPGKKKEDIFPGFIH
ncbi:MAG: hypothetical protein ABIG11_00620 [bacterium]